MYINFCVDFGEEHPTITFASLGTMRTDTGGGRPDSSENFLKSRGCVVLSHMLSQLIYAKIDL